MSNNFDDTKATDVVRAFELMSVSRKDIEELCSIFRRFVGLSAEQTEALSELFHEVSVCEEVEGEMYAGIQERDRASALKKFWQSWKSQ
jgi:hypothetical protein